MPLALFQYHFLLVIAAIGFLFTTSRTTAFTVLPCFERNNLPNPSLACLRSKGYTTTLQQQTDQNDNEVLRTDTVLTTKSSVLDKDLSPDEKAVVNVVRLRGPSVAYVTSYSIPPSSSTQQRQRQNRRQNRRRSNSRSGKGSDDESTKENKSDKSNNNPPPRSTPLGSGSAFAISSYEGYFVTNYHVIERAYRMQESQKMMDELIKNITQSFPFWNSSSTSSFLNKKNRDTTSSTSDATSTSRGTSQVYLRLSPPTAATSSLLLPARIVSVRPELDSAILYIDPSMKISPSATTSNSTTPVSLPPPIPYGSSSKLLVGQSVLAIGNPFGLDRTITTGVVSALDRSVRGVANNQINNCIQTDAAINPGNSGGPLLNSNGECIGMNTMIITTSGSNAGIGFAISMDDIREYVEDEIEKDRMEVAKINIAGSGGGKKKGYLGIQALNDEKIRSQLMKRLTVLQTNRSSDEDMTEEKEGIFVTKVERNSPAYDAQIKPTVIDPSTSKISIGDRIIAINSNVVVSYKDLTTDLKSRVVGEQLSITVENCDGERRVVYVTLVDNHSK